jgi:NitT/TauT family transport system substrate-binding protein
MKVQRVRFGHSPGATVRAVLATLAVLLVACGSAPSSPPPSATGTSSPAASTPSGPGGEQTLRVGILFSASDAGVLIAQDKGYFREQGLKLDFTKFDSAGQMIAPLGAGQLDVGLGAISAGLFNALARGIQVRVVADKGQLRSGYGYEALVVRKSLVDGGRWKGLSSLKGMKVALPLTGISPEYHLGQIAAKGGVAFSDIQTSLVPFPDMPAALQNGSVDAAMIIEPFLTKVVSSGIAVKEISSDEVDPDGENAVVLFGPDMEKRADVARKFMVAYLKGVRVYNDAFVKRDAAARREVVDILTKETSVKDAGLYDQMVMPFLNPNGTVNVASMKSQQDWYAARGEVQRKVNVDQVVEDSYVRFALQQLGEYR